MTTSIQCGYVEDRVLLTFGGVAVDWLALTPEQARQLARRLLATAEALERQTPGTPYREPRTRRQRKSASLYGPCCQCGEDARYLYEKNTNYPVCGEPGCEAKLRDCLAAAAV